MILLQQLCCRCGKPLAIR